MAPHEAATTTVPLVRQDGGGDAAAACVREDDAGGSASSGREGVDLFLVPHRGRVFLDTLADDSQVLTHTVSQERIRLPPARVWTMVFDDDGFAALSGLAKSDPADETVELVESLLTFVVYDSQDGMYIGSSKDRRHLVQLSVFENKYTESTMTVTFGTTARPHTFDCAIWKRQRNGAKVFISCKSLYEQLGMRVFERQPWRWAWCGSKRWIPWLDRLGLHEHFAFSNQVAPRCL